MKIILSAALAFFLLGCGDDATTNSAKTEITKQAQETATVIAKSTQDVVKKTKEASVVVAQEAKKVTAVAVEQAKEMTKTSVDKVKVASAEVAKTVSETTRNVVQKSAKAVEKVAHDVQTPALDGKKIFTACAGCHGVHAEKKALGKSHIIKGWNSAKIVAALHGYKDGSYGGSMKAIMKGQASKLSDDKIKAVANYISKQ